MTWPDFDPVTGFRQHPIPPEVRHLARGKWRNAFASELGAERHLTQIHRLEEWDRKASLPEAEVHELQHARWSLAQCWLAASGINSVAPGEAEVVKVDYVGFWYRRNFHDCTHFVHWPWRRPSAVDWTVRWLTAGVRVPRLLALLGWFLVALIVLSLLRQK